MNLELVRFIQAESREDGLGVFVAAVLSGIANGLFVVLINAAAKDFSANNIRYLAMFAVSVAIYALTKRYALLHTAMIVRSAVTKAHLRIADRLRKTDLLRFENIDRAQIHGTLTENSEIIFEASRILTSSGSAFTMLLFSFAYIAWLSMTAFFMALVLLGIGIAYFMVNQKAIDRELTDVVHMEGRFFGALEHMLLGFKEIKLHRAKNDDLYEKGICEVAEDVRNMKMDTEKRFVGNHIFAQLFFYLLVAAIVFLLPRITDTSSDTIVKVTVVILFIIGPLGILVDAFPMLSKATVSVQKIKDLEDWLENSERGDPEVPPRRPGTFSEISMHNVFFRYPDSKNGKGFAVGPLDFTVKRGEIVFVVGGNGSGKTTLMKILTGLYAPESGTLCVDGVEIRRENRPRHRERFSMILTDFHLFDRLYGLGEVNEDRVERLLEEMGIAEKVRVENGVFSTLDLSTGQKKRLAIVVALLEDREILVFDEVAADQDPEFRRYFYEKMLPRLREEGRTVVAVSHDDRFFHVGDRVVKMEYGAMLRPDEGGIR